MPEIDSRPVEESTSTAPVVQLEGDRAREPEAGIALCLSGGGYRAMLFHAGVLWRLAEAGYFGSQVHSVTKNGVRQEIGTLRRVSSVSGGSITAAVLGLKWTQIVAGNPGNVVSRYVEHVVSPVRELARHTLVGHSFSGAFSLFSKVLLPGSVSQHIARAYDKHLFAGAMLDRLCSAPRFVINASNLQSGALWRFMSPYMRDWRVGENRFTHEVSIARAVAASSAFPPFLAPATFKFEDSQFTPGSGAAPPYDLQRPPFTTKVQLADGGVYDNLGLETAFKRYRTLLVSDGGAPFLVAKDVPANWGGLSFRVLSVIDNQVRSLRKRLLLNAFQKGERTGAYWGIGQDASIYARRSLLDCPSKATAVLAGVDTDLASKEEALQERLINWGYAVSDASLRTWLDHQLPAPRGFPYARGV